MAFLLFITVLTTLSFSLNTHQYLFQFSIHAQQICQSMIENSTVALGSMTDSAKILNSCLCGVNLPNSSIKQLYLDTQLIHLLVVSAGHLYLIKKIAITLVQPISRSWSSALCMVLIGGYTILTGLQPPAVRAVVAMLLENRLRHTKLQLSAGSQAIIPSCICLSLFPEWILSPSLYLSSLANLSNSFTKLQLDRKQPILSFIFQCLFAQTLVGIYFSKFSFYGFLMNLTVGVLLGTTLLPVCFVFALLMAITPILLQSSLVRLFHLYNELIVSLTQKTQFLKVTDSIWLNPYSDLNWSFLILLIALLHIMHIQKARSK